MEAIHVACYFMKKINPLKKQSITPIKLQHLLYYSLGWHYYFTETPLFNDQFEAWVYGPVVREVQRHFHLTNDYLRLSGNEIKDVNCPPIEEETRKILDAVWDYYCDYNTHDLSEMVRREKPWQDARKGLLILESSNELISHDAIYNYFLSFKKKNNFDNKK